MPNQAPSEHTLSRHVQTEQAAVELPKGVVTEPANVVTDQASTTTAEEAPCCHDEKQ